LLKHIASRLGIDPPVREPVIAAGLMFCIERCHHFTSLNPVPHLLMRVSGRFSVVQRLTH